VLLLVHDLVGRFPVRPALPGPARVFEQRGGFAQNRAIAGLDMTSVIMKWPLLLISSVFRGALTRFSSTCAQFEFRATSGSAVEKGRETVVTVQKVGSIRDLNRQTWSCRHWLRQYAFQR
jgi:hypothetical protein